MPQTPTGNASIVGFTGPPGAGKSTLIGALIKHQRTLDRLARGVVLDGRRTAPAVVRLAPADRDVAAQSAVLLLTIREGRNRQVRRMCEAVGHPVQRLTRVRIGPLRDDRLRPGQVRDLTTAEVQALKKVASPKSLGRRR